MISLSFFLVLACITGHFTTKQQFTVSQLNFKFTAFTGLGKFFQGGFSGVLRSLSAKKKLRHFKSFSF